MLVLVRIVWERRDIRGGRVRRDWIVVIVVEEVEEMEDG